MASQKPETIFNIEELFADINRAFLSAVHQLKEEFADEKWKDSPYIYHMPKMHLSMRMALSYSNGKVKGIFKKSSKKEEQEVISTVDVDVVAVPRSLIPPEESDDG